MSIRISWDDDTRTLLRYQFEADWQWDDLYQAINDGIRLADSRFTEIDTIFDAADIRTPAGNMLFHARRLLELLPPERGHIVIVSSLPLLRNVVGILNQVHKSNFMIAHTLDEARALIAQHRASSSVTSQDDTAITPG